MSRSVCSLPSKYKANVFSTVDKSSSGPKSQTEADLEALSKRWCLPFYHKVSRWMDSVPLNKIIFFCSYGCFFIYSNARSCNLSSMAQPNWQKSGLFLKKYHLHGFGHELIPRWGKMVPMALPQQSSSTQSIPESDNPVSSQSNITKEQKWHIPCEKKTLWKYHFSLLFRAQLAVVQYRQLYSHTTSMALPLGHFKLILDV